MGRIILILLLAVVIYLLIESRPKGKPIENTEEHLFTILDLPDQASRREYLRKEARRRDYRGKR